jgi:two-component sensor histidine kinase
VQKPPSGKADASRTLRAMQTRVQGIAQTTQALARDIHPQVLNDLGLVRALRAECGAFEQHHAVPVRFRGAGSADAIPPPTALCLYRVAQEALRNIARHANAAHVRVTLDADAQPIRLQVQDDGVGFSPGTAACGKGMGLQGMAERCVAVGGTLEVESKPGAGTTIRATVPRTAAVPAEGQPSSRRAAVAAVRRTADPGPAAAVPRQAREARPTDLSTRRRGCGPTPCGLEQTPIARLGPEQVVQLRDSFPEIHGPMFLARLGCAGTELHRTGI